MASNDSLENRTKSAETNKTIQTKSFQSETQDYVVMHTSQPEIVNESNNSPATNS